MDSYREIENLIYAATRLADTTRYEEMYDLMEGCTFIVPKGLGPKNYKEDQEWKEIPSEELRELSKASPPKLWGENQQQYCYHTMSNLEIYVNEEAGTAWSFCRLNVFQGVTEISFPIQSIGIGSYEDTFKRVDGKWRYVTHKIDIEVFGDTSQHHYK